MLIQKQEGPEAVDAAPAREECKSRAQFSTSRPPTKLERVLGALVAGERLHRFMAERRLGEHALPSTVSTLHNDKGIKIARSDLTVDGYAGEPAHVSLYRLDPADGENMERARALLAALRAKRGAS